jgi:hypothetical protein
MSKRLAVVTAIKAMIEAALPGVEVLGLDGKDADPATVPESGRVIVMTGDPGDPEIDLSPLTYNYNHPVPISLSGYATDDDDLETVIDGMMRAIGVACEQDRTLGGLCNWIEPTAPITEYDAIQGTEVPKDADFMIVASYATSNPLT